MQYEVSEFILKSGGRGLIVNVPGAPVMSTQFNFRAGSRFVKDYAAKSETAHIMEHMAFGANNGFASAHDYDATFTKNGAYHNASTTDTGMTYVATCADFEWDRILDLQRSAICDPLFQEEEFKAEFDNVKSELTGYLSQADWVLWPRISQSMGEDTKTVQEGLDSMANISVEDIREHWKRTHTAGNLRFVVAGNFSGRLGHVREILNSFELPTGERPPMPVDEMHSAEPFTIRRKDVPSIAIGLSMVLPRRLSDDETAAMALLNHILNGTLHSRIQGAARKKGLLYYMWSKASAYEHNSSWDFGSEVNVEKLPAVVDLLVAEIRRILEGEIDESDIDEAKSYALGRHQMGIQTTGQLNGWLAARYFFDGRIEDFASEPDRIKAITRERIVDTAREFLANNCWTLGLYGNTDKAMAELLHEKAEKLF
ncbi:insulinase family protein [Candidatus Saccharibacteria bacterium]|nr:insulinase family protein [Candidatus Saccharibacteria bacterium]